MDNIKKLTDNQLIDYALEEINKLNMLFKQNNLEQYNRVKFRVNDIIVEIKKRGLALDEDILVKRILF
jgi:hypothetical protein